jgi:hypothetical protein
MEELMPAARSPVDIRAYLDEPTWAFVGNPVEVLVSLVVPSDEAAGPGGTLTLLMDEQGAEPQTQALAGDAGELHFYITPVSTGTRHYTVSYSGDSRFEAASRSFAYQVWTGPRTQTTLQLSSESVTVGEKITLTAQVTTDDGRALTGHSDGPIVFYSDGTSIGEGVVVPGSRGWQATLTAGYLPAGIHQLTARHESVMRYTGPESKPVSLHVLAPANPLPLDGALTPSVTGPYTVHMEVTLSPHRAGTPVPGGYVQFYSDGTGFGLPVPVAAGKAAADYWLPTWPRTFTFSAHYFGDSHYAPIRFPGQTLTVPLP